MNRIPVLDISRKIWKINIHKLKYNIDFFFFEMQIKQCIERISLNARIKKE